MPGGYNVPQGSGFSTLLKEGTKHYSGLEEAVFRNISACRELTSSLKSAYGPNGLNKMVINHLEKLYVTSDAATIVKELDVYHPAAKMLVMASHQQEQEAGDGTNFVIIFAGALLEAAEELLRLGLTTPEIISGYEMAAKKAQELLPSLACRTLDDLTDRSLLLPMMRSVIGSKQFGLEHKLADLVIDACVKIYGRRQKDKDKEGSWTFNVDSVRVLKVPGGTIESSHVVNGLVLPRQVESDVIKLDRCKVAVFTGPMEGTWPETKSTVLMNTAKELSEFSAGEEKIVEDQVRGLAISGAQVVVVGGKIGDMILHFCNKFGLMVVRVPSKFDIRRICRITRALPMNKSFPPPSHDELGYCDHVYLDEIGDTKVVVFKQDSSEGAIATVVLRGATQNVMDDMERAVDDGVNTFKALTKDNRVVAGAGACEIELARQLRDWGEKCAGIEQYAIQQFVLALEELPRCLAENSGVSGKELVTSLYAAHQDASKQHYGFDMDAGGVAIRDSAAAGVLDTFLSKMWGLKFAANVACTVLRIDLIVIAKPAVGAPKPQKKANWDDQD